MISQRNFNQGANFANKKPFNINSVKSCFPNSENLLIENLRNYKTSNSKLSTHNKENIILKNQLI
jgi:hypothetical protein